MTSKIIPVSRQKELVVQELQSELLIYDLTINKAFCLNETSAAVWQLCDGKNSVADISRLLSKKLKSPVTEDFVWLAIDQFKKDNLIAESDEIEINFSGLSRREAIRKAGFASMIALPVISSLIAPTAAMAQSSGSCVSTGNVCTFDSFKQSNCCNDLRCRQSRGRNLCTNCLTSGSEYALGSRSSAASCQDSCSNTYTPRNLCCDSTSPVTSSFTAPDACRCYCP